MDERKFKFLRAVLGEDGAKALAKAAERAPELEAALLPRSIMAWLGLTSRSDFEGRIPGNENTYVQFVKSEDRYSGSVAIGDEVYSFENALVTHLGACIAVALGADHERVSPRLKDLDVQRLGKNIDTLVKARVAIRELKKQQITPLAKMAIAAIPSGQEFPAPSPYEGRNFRFFNYDHVLPEQYRPHYEVTVRYHPNTKAVAALLHTKRPGADRRMLGDLAGQVVGYHQGEHFKVNYAEVEDAHRGSGLGLPLYEAAFSHAYHKLGARHIVGDFHSSLASKAHARLSDKHGMDYMAEPSEYHDRNEPGPFDERFAPYRYAIKDELPMSKHEPIPLEKMAISAIPKGTPLGGPRYGWDIYDYSHVLPEEHRANYTVTVHHKPHAGLIAAYLQPRASIATPVGKVKGYIQNGGTHYDIDLAEVDEAHRGKGLGLPLYEAAIAHAHHSGAKAVSGSIHSSLASKAHTRLSEKHGMDYKPTPTPCPGLASPEPGPFDGHHGPYEYAIKDEMDMSKAALSPQGGQEAPGPAAAPKEPGAPTPPAAPELKQTVKGPTVSLKPKLPKPPKPSTPSLLPEAQKLPGQRGNRPQLKVTKSEAEAKCPICRSTQFKADRFQGCMCFRDLAKSVKVTVLEDGYNLEFTKDWDQESILTLAESLGKK